MIERTICVICLGVGYLFGCIQTAYIVGRIKGVDIRKKGSGNLGATNTLRVLGTFWGIFTAVMDIVKVFAAELLMYYIISPGLGFPIDRITLFLYTGIGVVLGHDFPFYLNFKGGKGVAATAAVLISLWDWKMILIGVVVFFSVAVFTGYISLASMSLVTVELIVFIIFTQNGLIVLTEKWNADCYIIMIVMTLLCIFQHRENIARLVNGNENKFKFPKRNKEK